MASALAFCDPSVHRWKRTLACRIDRDHLHAGRPPLAVRHRGRFQLPSALGYQTAGKCPHSATRRRKGGTPGGSGRRGRSGWRQQSGRSSVGPSSRNGFLSLSLPCLDFLVGTSDVAGPPFNGTQPLVAGHFSVASHGR